MADESVETRRVYFSGETDRMLKLVTVYLPRFYKGAVKTVSAEVLKCCEGNMK